MTDKEKTKIIKTIVEHKLRLDENLDQIYKLFGSADSEFTDSIWRTFDSYLDTVEILLGDSFSNISWYIFDNDCGKKKLEYNIKNGKSITVKDIKDLLKMIKDTAE